MVIFIMSGCLAMLAFRVRQQPMAKGGSCMDSTSAPSISGTGWKRPSDPSVKGQQLD